MCMQLKIKYKTKQNVDLFDFADYTVQVVYGIHYALGTFMFKVLMNNRQVESYLEG